SGSAFIGCGNYPECRFTRPISGSDEGGSVDGRILGEHPDGTPISLRAGRFGPYVQKGEATEDVPKPPRASLPKGWSPESLTLERAITLLELPRQVGPHPEDGVMIEAAIGRFGPYVKHGSVYANVADVEEVFTIGMNRAVEVLAQKASRGRTATPATPLRELGIHPDGGPVQVMPGRYGPYVKWGKVNATLPKELTPEAVTLEEALALVAEKAGKGKKPARKAAAKPAAKKAAAKPKSKAAKPKAKKTEESVID
ncbi:MAG: topoisomerase C-terminal repeat-containing protein, partial [Paracoccaceae bacterium]